MRADDIRASATRRDALIVAAIVAGAAALRIATADYPLWFDELAARVFAHQPIGHLWGSWMTREANPPLYYTLLKGWMTLAGEGDRALRLLSIVIGLAGIVAAWSIAFRLGGARAAVAIALWLAVSPAHVAFSQQVRGYALAATAALIAIRAMIGVLDGRRAWLAVYAVAALVALYAHTTMVVFVALANVMMLWLLRGDRRLLVVWLAANALVALGWVWWMSITLAQIAAPSGNIAWIARPTIVAAWRVAEAAYLPTYVVASGSIAVLLLGAVFGVVGWAAWCDRRPAIGLLAGFTLGAPLALAALSQVQPVLLVRTLAWASAPAWIVVAVVLARWAERPLAVIATAAIAAVEIAALVTWLPMRESESWPEALAAIARTSPTATVFVEGDAMALAAQFHRPPGLTIVAVADDDRYDVWARGLYDGPHRSAGQAAAALHQYGSAFALVRGTHDPAGALKAAGKGRALPAVTESRAPIVWYWRATGGRP